jgi:hypothetical protein
MSSFGKKLKKQAVKLLQSDSVMKLMENPRVMNAVMQGFALKGKLEENLASAKTRLGEMLGYASQEEVDTLRATIEELETQLAEERAAAVAASSTTGKKKKS